MKSSELERLQSVLEEWRPPLPVSEDCAAAVRRRWRERRRQARSRWSVAAAASAAALLAGFIYLGPLRPPPVARTPEQMAVVQDLQMWNSNASLIENLNFLRLPPPPDSPAAQDKD
ncbi:MAG: hypothetical protein ACRD1Y_01495 [Terriglobales bacterium]